jgi:hypothetical protein
VKVFVSQVFKDGCCWRMLAWSDRDGLGVESTLLRDLDDRVRLVPGVERAVWFRSPDGEGWMFFVYSGSIAVVTAQHEAWIAKGAAVWSGGAGALDRWLRDTAAERAMEKATGALFPGAGVDGGVDGGVGGGVGGGEGGGAC